LAEAHRKQGRPAIAERYLADARKLAPEIFA
jgi:hypothetical protein